MKKYVFRIRQKDKYILEQIKKGQKTVETRVSSVRYRNILKGDLLIFICGSDRVEKTVKKVSSFKSVSQMLERYKIKQIMPSVKTKQEMEKVYYSFSGYQEKIKKHGLIALEI